jgi:formylmethanofuran dehydrogenase subunit E
MKLRDLNIMDLASIIAQSEDEVDLAEKFYNEFVEMQAEIDSLKTDITKETYDMLGEREQFKRDIVKEIKEWANNYFEMPICDNCGELINDDSVITSQNFVELLNEVLEG